LHDPLEAVGPVVGATQMRELVQRDLIDLFLGERLEQVLWNQHHRIEESDRNRYLDMPGNTKPDVPAAFFRTRPARELLAIVERKRQRVALERLEPVQVDRQPY
jgi:hypothetical protein